MVGGRGVSYLKEVQASRLVLVSTNGKTMNKWHSVSKVSCWVYPPASRPCRAQGQGTQDLSKVQLEGSRPLAAAERSL